MPYPTFFNLPEEKRQKFLACAIDEFAAHDPGSASVSRIVARAGIAKGSLYQYFSDKADLHHYLLELAAQKKAEMLAGISPPDPRMGLFDRLRWLFQGMAGFEIEYPQLARIGYRAVYGRASLPEDIVDQGTQTTRKYFTDLIEAGKERGEVRPEIDAEVAAFVFTAALAELNSYLGSTSLEGVSGANSGAYQAETARIYTQIVSILQHGIAGPAQSQQGKPA
jgi:AcrR family transcriptional regulator